jgi:hypothetical protein
MTERKLKCVPKLHDRSVICGEIQNGQIRVTSLASSTSPGTRDGFQRVLLSDIVYMYGVR